MHEVGEGARLQPVGGHDAQEVARVAQRAARRRVADLRDVEDAQQVLDLVGDGARAGPDQAGDRRVVARHARRRCARRRCVAGGGGGGRRAALEAGDRVLDEVDAALERDGRVPARVADVVAEADVGQQAVVGVDAVDGAQQHLDAMHAVLLPDLAALAREGDLHRRLAVDGEEHADDDVGVDARLPRGARAAGTPRRRAAGGEQRRPEPPRSHRARRITPVSNGFSCYIATGGAHNESAADERLS